jgi:NAD(P)-dependent dehydrogenase (short-subunit alcohol dehydrogenase family)
LITGASGGIGQATAIACAGRGARIGIHYNRNRQGAETLLAALPGNGHSIFQSDVTNPSEVKELVARADEKMNGLDVLVNNAGIHETHQIDEIDYRTWQESWRRIMEANLMGPANLSFCAAKVMMARGGGRIVNVSSRGAFRGEPNMPWYGASKAGLNAMGQSMAQALAPKGVLVYTVAPGFVETDMARGLLDSPAGDAIRGQSPFNRVARPEEVADAIRYLALEAPVFMTGCIIDVNGASYLRT